MTLQSEDMGKLVAGKSVLRRDDGGLHVFQRAKSPSSRLICTRSIRGSVERFYAPERFTLVGCISSDGWIEGEWDESPAGLFKGEYRYFDLSVERGLSDEVCWPSVIAFRPAHCEAQPEIDRGIFSDPEYDFREAQPETDGGGEVEVVAAARAYFEGWMQDEAADEGPEWTGCSKEQHLAAKRLKEALAALASKGV